MSGAVNLKGRRCILLGAGGHARVVAELATAIGAEVLGVCDPVLFKLSETEWFGWAVLGDDDHVFTMEPGEVALLNGVGKMPGSNVRARLFEKFVSEGFEFPPLVHPAAWVSPSAEVGEGAQVMAGAVVQAGTWIERNCILNTRCSVDHDSRLGEHCHIAPGVTICGDVGIGAHAFVGAGATIVQGSVIGPGGFVRAGSLVSGDQS